MVSEATQGQFNTWMKRVDAQLISIAGVSSGDLADQMWWDWMADGLTPAEAARLALEDEGFPFEGE